MQESIKEVISTFQPISLTEMDGVALLKRVDTKFLLPGGQLPEFLEEIKETYKILEIHGKRILSYRSLYFDTPQLGFYKEHHSGKIKRTKVRIRKYIDSNLFFLEVKQKDGKGNTNKSRIKIQAFEESLTEDSKLFIEEVTQKKMGLRPSLWNHFHRMTLVNAKEKERVTIDIGLAYEDMAENEANVGNIVIIELKQERFNHESNIVKALRKRGIRKYGFSKYCIGMIKLYSSLKYNRFKPKLLKIKKLTA